MQLEKIQQIVKCSIVPFWGWTEVSENQGHGEGTKVTLPCTSSGSVPGSQRLCWMQDRSRPSYITWKKLTPCRSLGSVYLVGSRATGSSRHLPTSQITWQGREKKATRASCGDAEPGTGWPLHLMERQGMRDLLQQQLPGKGCTALPGMCHVDTIECLSYTLCMKELVSKLWLWCWLPQKRKGRVYYRKETGTQPSAPKKPC